MVSGEAVPFCKTGGLADVVGALSQALAGMGHDARVLLPLYGSIDQGRMEETGLTATVSVDGKEEEVTFLKQEVENVPYYFVSHPLFTGRKGIYGRTSVEPYNDNIERYTLLDKAALALPKLLGWKADVVHCHDWTTGLVPYMMQKLGDPFYKDTMSMLTIHNLAYQGDFSRMDFLKCDLPAEPMLFKGHASGARTNFLMAGIAYSDEVTTVSPTYAREIMGEEYGCGLDWLLREKQEHVSGIINGIDYQEWDPRQDRLLPVHYSADHMEGKAELKRMVQKEFGLAVDDAVPMVSMISRIAEQKGFKQLLDGYPCALERIVRDNKVQMIVIGTGEHSWEEQMREIGSRYPNLSVNILFDNRMAHMVEAASDYFLMPSRFEPCGLNQLYSLRYGTLPIVRRTGGLADSVSDLDQNPETGTGFVFDTLGGSEIEQAVRRALAWWPALQVGRRNAMKGDYSWEKSAEAYARLYARGGSRNGK